MVTTTRGWILLGLGAILTVGALLSMRSCSRNAPGRLMQAHFLAEPTDGVMLAIAQSGGRAHYYRMDLVNLENGTRITRAHSDGVGLKCFGHDANRLWMYDDDLGVHARSPSDLSVLIDQKDIEKKNPAIAKGIRSQGFGYHGPSEVIVESKTGEPFSVDPNTLAATPYKGVRTSTAATREQRRGRRETGDDFRAFLDDGWELHISDERGLERIHRARSQYIAFDRTTKYPHGKFLRDCRGTHVSIGSPKSFVITHEKVKGDFRYSMITRVSQDGVVLWEKQLDEAEVDSGYAYKNLVVIAFGAPLHRAIAFNAGDGRPVWTYEF
jgi:hypothetical protein